MTGFIDHFPGLMKVHCGWHLFMNVNEQKEVQAKAEEGSQVRQRAVDVGDSGCGVGAGV